MFARAERRYTGGGPIDRFQAVCVRRNGLLLAVLLAGSGLAAWATADVDPRQEFPLIPGTQWTYRGYVRSQEEGSTIGKVTGVTWTMSVERTVERDGIVAAVVRGFPADLDWSAGDAMPQRSVLLETRDGKVYLNGQENAQPLLDQIDDPKYPMRELASDHDLVFQLPLAAGKKFCDAEQLERTDGRYCWVVGSPHPAELAHVKGAPSGARTAYPVEFDTNPDDCEFEFVEGVGITRYEYHHHGTTADTVLRLVEFHPAETAAAR